MENGDGVGLLCRNGQIGALSQRRTGLVDITMGFLA